jgi:hypothetical protein
VNVPTVQEWSPTRKTPRLPPARIVRTPDATDAIVRSGLLGKTDRSPASTTVGVRYSKSRPVRMSVIGSGSRVDSELE